MRKIVLMTFFMTLMLLFSLFAGIAISDGIFQVDQSIENNLNNNGWWNHWNRDQNHNGIDDVLDDMIAINPETERTKIFIDYSESPIQEDIDLLSNFELEIRYVYNIVDTVCARNVLLSDIERISRLPNVVMVEYEDDVHTLLDISARAVKAVYSDEYTPDTVEEMDILGRGVSVAILDTGVDDGPAPAPPPYHISVDDMDDDIVTNDPKFIAGVDTTHIGYVTDGSWNPDDAFVPGHGTHVASTAIGTDAGSDYRGIAPSARLVDVKVMERVGTGSMAEVIRGIEWCVEHKDDDFDGDDIIDGIDILSMSIGATYNSNGDDAASQAVNAAVDAGLVAVVAIGNDGANRVPPPASADKAIVVGAINDMGTITRDDDTMWGSSNYGPRMDDGDTDHLDELKPDVVAPGVNILAAKSSTSTVYASYSGTSMATPHVSGVIALMLEANPDLTPSEIKEILHASSEMPPGIEPSTEYDDVYNYNWGWGMVDAYEALRVAQQADDTPPQIFDINVAGVSTTTATIEWTTNKPSNSIIHYGETQSLGSSWEDLDNYEISHSMTIEGLTPNTDYYFNILGYDEFGNGPGESGIQDPFHTDIVEDTTPPVIIEGPNLIVITDTSATIYWETDEISDSVVEYGVDQTYGITETDVDDVIEHYITLVDLQPSQEYHYRVQSTDPSGNTIQSSDDTFQTASGPDTTPPEITKLPEAIDITENSAVIIWETDEPSTTLVRYGGTTAYGNETADSTPVLSHSIKITGLTPQTIYYYQIESKDMSGNVETYDDGVNTKFNTTGIPDTTKPNIIDGPKVTILTDSMASIEWETDEESDSTVEYGLDKNDYGAPESSSAFVLVHNITLMDLSSSTPYFYRVRSKDNSPNANENVSEEFTFTTKAPADLKPPKILAGPYILEVGEDTATITWTTNEESDSRLHYGTTSSYGSTKSDPAFVKEHNIILTDLNPYTEYHYKVSSSDESGNDVESDDYTFTTLGITIPIEIEFLNLQNGQIVSGVINVEGTVSGGKGSIEWVKYKVDNETWQNLGSGNTFSIVLDTKMHSEGEHTLFVQAKVGEMSMQEDITFFIEQQNGDEGEDNLWVFLVLIVVIILLTVLAIARSSSRKRKAEDESYMPPITSTEVPFSMDAFASEDMEGIGFIPDEPPEEEFESGVSFIPDEATFTGEPEISFIPDREPVSFNISEDEPISFAVFDTVRCPKCKKIFNADISSKMVCPECGFGADLKR